VREDGGAIEMAIDAYAADEDTKVGGRGRVVSKGKLIAQAMMASFVEGFSKMFFTVPAATLSATAGQNATFHRRHLRALFNHAVERGWVESNPFKAVCAARPDRERMKTVEDAVLIRARRLLQTEMARGREEDERLRPAWFWAILLEALRATGVRRHQIVALRWGDVDLVRREWRIPAPRPARPTGVGAAPAPRGRPGPSDLARANRRAARPGAHRGRPSLQCHAILPAL